jgi:hypothetical protein
MINRREDFEQTTKILDRMTLYEIVNKYLVPGQTAAGGDDYSYSWTKGFMDFINILGQLMHENPEVIKVYRALSGLEFIEGILLPKYLAMIRIHMKKGGGGGGAGDHYVEVSMEEISEETDKTLDLEKMPKAELYELEYMSKLVQSKLLWDLKSNRISLPNTIITQIKRGVSKI